VNNIEYIVVSDGEGYPESARALTPTDFPDPALVEEWEMRCLAEDAAEDDYNNCGGWERTRTPSGYPITVELFIDGVSAGQFSVSCDFSPDFYALRPTAAGGAVAP